MKLKLFCLLAFIIIFSSTPVHAAKFKAQSRKIIAGGKTVATIDANNVVTRLESQPIKSSFEKTRIKNPRNTKVLPKILNLKIKAIGMKDPPADIDPDLEPGFPISAANTTGSYQSGAVINVVVGNIDTDPQLEMMTTALGRGPMYAWNNNGTPVSGWPKAGPRTNDGVAYLSLGRLHAPDIASIFAGFHGGSLAAYAGNGDAVKYWPRLSANVVRSPAALADVIRGNEFSNGPMLVNKRDEIFIGEEDSKLHGYDFQGKTLPGYPASSTLGGPKRNTPAIGDLDGDGINEIVTASGRYGETITLFAYHQDGTAVTGFPVNIGWGYPLTFPVIGDVDGDGQKEIVLVKIHNSTTIPVVAVYSATGTLEWQTQLANDTSITAGSAPALADLNGDHIPEIIVQSDERLYVFRGNGTAYPGWPKLLSYEYWQGNSAPVVGDVDGDGQQDIVIAAQLGAQQDIGYLYAFRANGTIIPRFPKIIDIGAGSVPAIADIDLDGRNEIIVCADYWNGVSGDRNKCWAYDYRGTGPYGHVEWGQFGGNEAHQNVYPVPRLFCPECM